MKRQLRINHSTALSTVSNKSRKSDRRDPPWIYQIAQKRLSNSTSKCRNVVSKISKHVLRCRLMHAHLRQQGQNAVMAGCVCLYRNGNFRSPSGGEGGRGFGGRGGAGVKNLFLRNTCKSGIKIMC